MEIKVDNASIEQIVKGHIQAAMVQALASKSDYVIGELVRLAMTQTTKDSYGRETIIDSTINKAVIAEAHAAVGAWLDEQRPKIRDIVRKKLDVKTKDLVASIADQMTAGLRGNIKVDVRFRGSDD